MSTMNFRRRAATRRTTVAAALCAVALCACNVPRDPGATLDRVRGATMRVGAVANPPWVVDQGTEPAGVEAAFVADLARTLGARVEWRRGPESALFEELKERRIDLLVGGFRSGTPWEEHVALSRPYMSDDDDEHPDHVLAAPPGENAWMMEIDRVLAARQSDVPRLLEEARSGDVR